MKQISLDLHLYCSDLEKIFKLNKGNDNAVNSMKNSQPMWQKKWQCKICHKAYVAMNLLTQHTQNIHDKERFPCTFEGCSKTFTTENGVKSHLKHHTAPKTKMCDKCCRTFLTESELKAHMLTHYDKQFHCELCNKKSFRYKADLNVHKKSCQELLLCTHCDKGFKGGKNLHEHILGKHSDKENWRYQCLICTTKPKFQYREISI